MHSKALASTLCKRGFVIYLLANRESASKYSYQSPIAKVIVDEGSFLYSDISLILEENYHLISSVGAINLYLRAPSN